MDRLNLAIVDDLFQRRGKGLLAYLASVSVRYLVLATGLPVFERSVTS